MFAPRMSGTTARLVGGTFAARPSPAHIARLAIGSSRSSLGFSFRCISESSTNSRALSVGTGAKPKTSASLAPSSSLVPGQSLPFGTVASTSTSPILAQTRYFSSSTLRSLRESYFRRPNGRSSSSGYGKGGPGGGGGPGWFGNFRRRLDSLNPMWVVYGLIGTNVAIFLVWQYAQASWSRFRDPTLYQWMSRNFIVSEANLAAGRIHTLLTCCFSHSNTSHIALNMLGLYFIGPATAGLLGPASFLGLYLGGGIVSSTVSLLWHRMMSNNRSKNHGSEGASGAIYASLAYYAAMFPQAQFLLFFIVPLPAWAAVGGIFAYDLYSSIRSPNAVTDSAGHVGGLLAGVAYAFWSKGRGGPRFRGRW